MMLQGTKGASTYRSPPAQAVPWAAGSQARRRSQGAGRSRDACVNVLDLGAKALQHTPE